MDTHTSNQGAVAPQPARPDRETCALCGGWVRIHPRQTSWSVKPRSATSRTMGQHLRKCRRATAAERAYFAQKRQWPYPHAKTEGK